MSLFRRAAQSLQKHMGQFFELNPKLSRPALVLMLAATRLGPVPVYVAEGLVAAHLFACFFGDKANKIRTGGRGDPLLSKENLSLLGAGLLLVGHAGWGTLAHGRATMADADAQRIATSNTLVAEGMQTLVETQGSVCYTATQTAQIPDFFSWGRSPEAQTVRIVPDATEPRVDVTVQDAKGRTLRHLTLPFAPHI